MGESTNNTKQAAWVATGNFFTFSFGIISAMVLSRYFDKTEYGTYKQVFYIYNILLGMFTLGLPNAYSYFLARSPLCQAKNLIRKMTRLFMVLGAVMSLVLLLGAGTLADVMKNPELKEMLIVFAAVPFLMLPTIGLQNILVTFRCSNIIPMYIIITSLTQLVCVILPVIIWDVGCKGALIGFSIGSLIAFGIALYLNTYPVRNEPEIKTDETYHDIFKFALPLFVATVWGTLINSTDQFFISRYFGTEVFADFSNGATDLPFVGMIIGATSAVLTPLFARKVKEGCDYQRDILPIWNAVFAKSAMLIYPLTIFCFFEAGSIMTVMYGDSYADSSIFFRIKLLTYFVKVVAYYSLIIALGSARFYQMVFMFFFFLLVSFELIVIKFFDSPYLVVAVNSIMTVASCLVFIKFIANKICVPVISMFPYKILLKIICSASLLCLLIELIRNLFYPNIDNLFGLILNSTLFAILFFISALILKIRYIEIIKPLFKR